MLVHLLLDKGLRLAEVLALDHADVSGSRDQKRLRVVRHGDATNIALGPSASRSMGVLERRAPNPGPLFTGPSRRRTGPTRLTRFGADHLVKQAATTAGIQRSVSANVLRRTHVTTAQGEGMPIDEIRRNMGHRDVRSTRRYLAPRINNTTTS
jgi:integrase/recombinase XerD